MPLHRFEVDCPCCDGATDCNVCVTLVDPCATEPFATVGSVTITPAAGNANTVTSTRRTSNVVCASVSGPGLYDWTASAPGRVSCSGTVNVRSCPGIYHASNNPFGGVRLYLTTWPLSVRVLSSCDCADRAVIPGATVTVTGPDGSVLGSGTTDACGLATLAISNACWSTIPTIASLTITATASGYKAGVPPWWRCASVGADPVPAVIPWTRYPLGNEFGCGAGARVFLVPDDTRACGCCSTACASGSDYRHQPLWPRTLYYSDPYGSTTLTWDDTTAQRGWTGCVTYYASTRRKVSTCRTLGFALDPGDVSCPLQLQCVTLPGGGPGLTLTKRVGYLNGYACEIPAPTLVWAMTNTTGCTPSTADAIASATIALADCPAMLHSFDLQWPAGSIWANIPQVIGTATVSW